MPELNNSLFLHAPQENQNYVHGDGLRTNGETLYWQLPLRHEDRCETGNTTGGTWGLKTVNADGKETRQNNEKSVSDKIVYIHLS